MQQQAAQILNPPPPPQNPNNSSAGEYATSAAGDHKDPYAQKWTNPFSFTPGVAANRFQQLLALRPDGKEILEQQNIFQQAKGKRQRKIPVKLLRCNDRKIDCNTKKLPDSHKKGKRHDKNLENLKATFPPAPALITPVIPNIMIVSPQDNPENGKSKAKEPADIESKKKNILENGAVVDAGRTCEVCDVACVDEIAFKDHLAGKKHKRKNNILENGAGVNAARTCEVCDVVCFNEIAFKNHLAGKKHKRKKNILENGAGVDAPRTCEVCDVVCGDEILFKDHLAGKKHKRKTNILENGAGVDAPRTCEVCDVKCFNEIAFKHHLAGKKHKRKNNILENGAGTCEVCDVVCVNEIVFKNHLAGKKHKRKQNNLENGAGFDATRTCEVCDVKCFNEIVFKGHLAGKKHKKNIEKTKVLTPKTTEVYPAPVTLVVPNDLVIGPQGKSKKRKAEGNETKDLESNKKIVLQAGAAVDTLKTCEPCNVICKNELSFTDHLLG